MPGMWGAASQRERETSTSKGPGVGELRKKQKEPLGWGREGHPGPVDPTQGPASFPSTQLPSGLPGSLAALPSSSWKVSLSGAGALVLSCSRQSPSAQNSRCLASCRGSALAAPARCERTAGSKMSVFVLGLSCQGPGALPQGWPGWEGPGGLLRVSPGREVPERHCLQTLKFFYVVVFFSE